MELVSAPPVRVPPIHVLKSAKCFGAACVPSLFLNSCSGGRRRCGSFSRRGSRGGGRLNNLPKAEPHLLCLGPLLPRPRSATPCCLPKPKPGHSFLPLPHRHVTPCVGSSHISLPSWRCPPSEGHGHQTREETKRRQRQK